MASNWLQYCIGTTSKQQRHHGEHCITVFSYLFNSFDNKVPIWVQRTLTCIEQQ
jgi:hypothetical protein